MQQAALIRKAGHIMNIETQKSGHKTRFNHDGFLVGSTWVDSSTGKTVQVVDGQGVAGMPEVKQDDGFTYYADPRALQPYST